MIDFALRNTELFFRDKMSVLMSMLAEVIIMTLYIIFMRDNLRQQFILIENAEIILDVWMIAGIVGITPVTAAMGTYSIMIQDKMSNIDRDFRVSPLGPVRITCGYVMSAVMTGMVLSFIIYIISEIYLMINYGSAAGNGNVMKIYGVIILDSVCSAAMVILPVSFLKTSNSLAGCCTIFGALIGFLTGIYLPIGSLGNGAAISVKCFPVSHAVILFRHLLTEPVISKTIDINSDEASEFMEYMGVKLIWQGEIIQPHMSIMFLILCAAICLVITVLKHIIYEKHR